MSATTTTHHEEAPVFTIPQPTIAQLQALDALESFVGFGGISLKVNTRSWPAGTDWRDAVAGTVIPDAIVATQDGRHLDLRQWHVGDSSGDVYYERYEVREGALVMVAHGWVDALSRQLVQAG